MNDRFSERALQVMRRANVQAQRFCHEFVGTEHILLGLVQEHKGVAVWILHSLGVDRRRVRREVEKELRSGSARPALGKLPNTPRARNAIELASEEARFLGHFPFNTGHLLLGLLREKSGMAALVLTRLGLKAAAVREAIQNVPLQITALEEVPSGSANKKRSGQMHRRVDELLGEVNRLAEMPIAPSVFFREMLKRLLKALDAPAGAVWLRTPQGSIHRVAQVRFREASETRSEQARQSHDELLHLGFTRPRPLHLPPHSGLGPGRPGKPAPANPSQYALLLAPIANGDHVEGLIEVWQNPHRPLNAVPGFLQYMDLMAEVCSRVLRHRREKVRASWTSLDELSRKIHSSLDLREVASVVASDGRRLIECDRVSVAVRSGWHCLIEAVSGPTGRDSMMLELLHELCDCVLDWDEKLVFTGEKDDSLPPEVQEALGDYLAESSASFLVIQPLRVAPKGTGADKHGRRKPARAALVAECVEPPADAPQMLGRVDAVARHAASALDNAIEHQRIPLRWLWLALANLRESKGLVVLAILLVAVIVVCWMAALVP
jgi:hypothetical protein